MNKIKILGILTVLIIFAIFSWWTRGTLPANATDHSQKLFVVRKGEGIRTIAAELQQQGFIKDQLVFIALVKQLGLDGKIQAGDFRVSPSQTPQQIIETLTKGTLDIWVTIPEGKRAAEISEILQNKLPTYDTSWKIKLVEQEGYLFPDTYLFPHDANVTTIINIMTNNFEKKYKEASSQQTTKLARLDVVVLASILEREGRSAQDMKMIASVLENRLNIGMPLQVDASVQYALGYQPNEKDWWKKDLTTADLHIDSPYNTYLNPGLPPTPISNPGLNALTAILAPASTNYFYYISDKTGTLHFARTLDEQNANIRKFGL